MILVRETRAGDAGPVRYVREMSSIGLETHPVNLVATPL
jgi:hypothetical protein